MEKLRKSNAKLVHLLWLNWPISSFRLDARSLAVYKKLAKGRVVAVRSERAFLKALPEATHAVCWEFKKEWFALAKSLRILATPAAGRELLPSDAEMPPGIVRVNGAFHGQIMSETVIACIFAHARGLYLAHEWQKDGVLWPRSALSPLCRRVSGTRAVILGHGKIGRVIGAKLEALGVSVVGITRRNVSELKNACRAADWLIMALPSDTGTDDIVDASVLRSLPRRAVLINVGRGNAVDEKALACALRSRRIAAAFLDVFKNEPLTSASPMAEDIPGLHRLPHASAFAPDYLELFFRELAATCKTGFAL